MQNFALVTCRHTTVPLLLQVVKTTLDQIAADPKTAHFSVHTMQLIPAVEMPDSKVARMDGQMPQPQMCFYASILLVANKLTIGGEASGAHYDSGEKELSADDLTEIEKIKEANKLMCKHTRLLPEKLYKGYRGPDHWYRICADCGAEVWNDKMIGYNQHVVNGKMEFYEKHPGECDHLRLEDSLHCKRDAKGHKGMYKNCADCGTPVYQGEAWPLDETVGGGNAGERDAFYKREQMAGDYPPDELGDRKDAWQHDGEDI